MTYLSLVSMSHGQIYIAEPKIGACKNLKPIQEMAREPILQLELCTKEANNGKVYFHSAMVTFLLLCYPGL